MSAPAPHHLPEPTEAGVLPEGIHDATLDQIQERFARFQGSTRRIGLFEKLKRYLEELRKTGWLVTVIVDGSFVMECVDAPSDIDIYPRVASPLGHRRICRAIRLGGRAPMAGILSETKPEMEGSTEDSHRDQEGIGQDRYLIRSAEEFELVQEQLGRARAALASLERDVKPLNEARFNLMAEIYIEEIKKLERLLQENTRPTNPATHSPSIGTQTGPQTNQSSEPELALGRGLRDLDAGIEAELEAAMGGLSEQELYGDMSAKERRPAAGQEHGRKKGRVLSVHGPDVFVDVPGGRSQGVLSITQFPEGPPQPGVEVEVDIEGYDQANGLLLLTRKGAAQTADWSTVAVNMVVEARVTGTNKGGLSVDVNGIRGFMPISQVDLYRVENPEQFVNQRLRCLVAEVNPAERNLVVSRRALLEKEREEIREKLWQELAEGQIRDGVVRSVKDFGAFVDLGGVDGLVHVSEMSWSRVEKVDALVQPGQTVKVVVLKIDRDRRKISLGMKQLVASPWDNITGKYPLKQVVSGKVTRLADFGAFVELEPGVEGLIHISELSPQRVRRVADLVQPEQQVQVMVLSVDPVQRRISLSLKAALPEESEAGTEETPEAPPKPPRPRPTSLRGGLGEH